MKAIELLNKLKSKPAFSLQDIERLAECNNGYAKQTLNRLKKRGLIKQVRRNLYTVHDDIEVVASNIVCPSYISFWYASSSLGYTEQILRTVHVATTRKVKPIRFENYVIKFVPLKHFFGYKKMRASSGEVFFVEDEKLLIDAFLRPRECGNFDEIEKMFEGANVENERLVQYLKRVDNMSVTKRVGYLIEKTKGIDISHKFRLDKNYVQLNPFSTKSKVTNSKWRVKL